MSLAKRLTRIETSLTPKQAVLLWLQESQQLDYIEYLEKSFKNPRHEAPRARISVMVGNAVREGLRQQGIKPELIADAVRAAQKQADFLIVLVRDLKLDVEVACMLNAPYILLLYEKFQRMLEHYVHDRRFEPNPWGTWRAIMIQRLSGMWQLREIITEIGGRYYDHHSPLFPEQQSRLNELIRILERLTWHYNSLKGGIPIWTRIDSDTLLASIRKEVSAEVDLYVAIAKSTTLEDFGESDTAWKMMEPYCLAMIERLRSSRTVQHDGD